MKRLTLIGLLFIFAAAAFAAPVPTFVYDGQPADLASFTRGCEEGESTADFTSVIERFTAPDGRFQVELHRKS